MAAVIAGSTTTGGAGVFGVASLGAMATFSGGFAATTVGR